MIVGCYSVDLYCDNSSTGIDVGYVGDCLYRTRETPQFTGETEAACLRAAKRVGWKIVRNRLSGRRYSYCPACSEQNKVFKNVPG